LTERIEHEYKINYIRRHLKTALEVHKSKSHNIKIDK